MEQVAAIWYRNVTEGDFFNIERSTAAGPRGGGGQLFIDIPTQVRRALFRFLRVPEPGNNRWPALRRDVRAIGAPDRQAALRFELNRKGEERYRIPRQNRQISNSERHPAWTAPFGFPRAPDDVASHAEAGRFLPRGGLRIFLVRTTDGHYYAGHTQGSAVPRDWPGGLGLEELFAASRAGGVIEPPPVAGQTLYLDAGDARTPFKRGVQWSREEAALLLDAYLEHGPKDAGSDEIRRLRARLRDALGRDVPADEISTRLSQLASADPVNAEGAADEEAEGVWDEFGGDADALRSAVEQIQDGPQLDLGATAGDAEVQIATVESALVTQYRVRGTVGTIAERREQKLVHEYKDYLVARRHRVTAHVYVIPGYPKPLRCDMFDETDGALIEAKGVASREAVRMALGELLDYTRFEKRRPSLRVLLPSKPAPDLLELIHSVKASAVWKTPYGFDVAEP
jgi:hypothetical protein